MELPAPDPADIGVVVRAWLDEHGLHQIDLAALAGVSNNVISRVVNNTPNGRCSTAHIRPETAKLIAWAMDMSPSRVFHPSCLRSTGRRPAHEAHTGAYTAEAGRRLEVCPTCCIALPASGECDSC